MIRLYISLIALSFVLGAAPPSAAADWRDQGPRALVMSYRVAPTARVLFKDRVRAGLLPRLEALRVSGDLDSYHVLISRYVDAGAWDLMVILNFHSSEALASWRDVEASAPAGLDAKSLSLVSQVESAPANLVRESPVAKADATPPVYLVVPYDYVVSTDDYLTYVDGYLVPQVEGWRADGALASYGVYLARYYPARPWSSMLLLAYRGDEGLARRDAVVKAVRTRLSSSPEWKKFADNKATVRTEKLAVVADELQITTPGKSGR